MYSFAQRSDMRVLDEPIFAHFLTKTGATRPSRDEVLEIMSSDPKEIAAAWRGEVRGHLFLKHMANHLEQWPIETLDGHRHLILTRNPRSVLKSFQAHVESPTMMDLAYQHQLDWWNTCNEKGLPVAVLDSDKLVGDPVHSLRRICDWLALPFEESMLSWPQGPRPEDGVWAKYWYQRIHASTGWEAAPSKSTKQLSPQPNEAMRKLLDQIEPIYLELKMKSII